ncbi:DUF1553 domain-containing protein [soil metagenome]
MRTFIAFYIVFQTGIASAADVDYARDVLPILAEQCYHCHGPDAPSRKAGLRLDTKDGAFRTKDGVTTLVPGKSKDSEVIRRILATDEEMMPPAESNRKLTAKQKETLKAWVDQGAKWGQHWAYVPLPKTVAVPAGHANAIDAFIHERLKKESLAVSPAATREAWLRRVTFDLNGLPPTPEEVAAFLKDQDAKAYETVVNRLLASPRYGERMASDWLDVARFADTLGYQSDKGKAMWPYRDWVITSFNRNQHFDKFLTEQLAGDLIPNATKDQRLATAFNRLHMQNEEGGIIAEEYRVNYVVDRVNTFGTAFLGQTFECTRCHDHKYDPITQKDYYSLFSFFQNVDESGQTSYFTNSMNTPTLLLSTPEQDAKIKELQAKVKVAEALLERRRLTGDEQFEDWYKNNSYGTRDLIAEFDASDFTAKEWKNKIDAKKPGKPHQGPKLTKDWIALDGENGFEFPGVGHFTKSDPFTIMITIKADILTPRAVVLHHSKAPVDAGSRGYEIVLEDGHVAFGLHHMWPGNSIKVRTKETIKTGESVMITVSYDGSSKASGVSIWLNRISRELDVIRDGLTKDIAYDGGEPNLTFGYRFRDNGFKGGYVQDLAIFDRAFTKCDFQYANAIIIEIEVKVDGIKRDLKDYYFSAVHGGSRDATKELRNARRELAKFIEPIPEAMVMDEMKTPKPAYILKRGAYDSLGEQVTADTPKSLPGFPANAPRNRLGLAIWLTQPDHPLTARVTVNRLWQQMFGRGIVETSDNFGTTGTPPTHPELLDWLARDFVDHDWDVKRALKQIVLSETYRMSSRTTPEVRAKDPYNTLLARAPVRRLSAEMLRDQALFTSGLLTEKLGGASVYPYQPEGLWNDAMGKPHYPQSKGEGLYRRSLYTYWKRTAPPPTMTTFDAADRQNCAAKRQATSTPLQALVLLNDPQYVEAARFLAERMMNEKTTADRIAFGVRTVLGREAKPEELKVLTAIYDEQKSIDVKSAEKLLSVGEKPRNKTLDAIEHAAFTQVALTLFNHDEAVNRR